MIRSFLRRNHLFFINFTSASGLLATSDLCVQVFYEKQKDLDKKRLLAAFTTGAAMGVEGHVWYSFLDRVIPQSTWRNVFKKVLLDQTLAAPFYTLTYILGTSAIEGRTSYGELLRDTQNNFPPLYFADCLVYVPVQIINFRFIPAFYRVPFLSVVALIFDAFISAYKHEHEELHLHNNQK